MIIIQQKEEENKEENLINIFNEFSFSLYDDDWVPPQFLCFKDGRKNFVYLIRNP